MFGKTREDGETIKVVGITSCSAGIAHTYMNAEAMVKLGKQYGIKVHIEKQGQLGPEDVVSQEEFDSADAIIICCGVTPIGPERFEKYAQKTITLDFNEVLKRPQIMIETLKSAGLIPEDLQKIK